MKKILLSFIIICSIITFCTTVKANDNNHTDGNHFYKGEISETKTFDIQNFSGVKVSQNIKVEIIKSDVEKVVVTSKYMQYLNLEVTEGVLNIFYDNTKNLKLSNTSTKIIIYARKIESLEASNSGHIKVPNAFSSNNLQITLSSSGKISGDFTSKSVNIDANSAGKFEGNIITQNLNGTASSAGQIILIGKTRYAKLEVNSSGKINGDDFEAGEITALASSTGYISVIVDQKITAHASSNGKIRYQALHGIDVVAQINQTSGGSINAF